MNQIIETISSKKKITRSAKPQKRRMQEVEPEAEPPYETGTVLGWNLIRFGLNPGQQIAVCPREEYRRNELVAARINGHRRVGMFRRVSDSKVQLVIPYWRIGEYQPEILDLPFNAIDGKIIAIGPTV